MNNLFQKNKILPLIVVVMILIFIKLITFSPEIYVQGGGNFNLYHNSAMTLYIQGNFGGENIAPAWPFFIFLSYKFLGPNMFSLYIALLFISVLIIINTYYLGLYLYDKSTAVLSSLILSVWPIFIIQNNNFGHGILLYTLNILLGISLIHLSIKKHFLFSIPASFFFAIAALSDSVALYIPVAIVFYFLYETYKKNLIIKDSIKILIPFILVFVILICPWAIRNNEKFGNGAPIVVKNIEKNIFTKNKIKEVSGVLRLQNWPVITNGLLQMYIIPYKIHEIEKNSNISYSKEIPAILSGENNLEPRQYVVFFVKLLITILNLIILILSISKIKEQATVGKVTIFIVSYVTIAVILYGSLSNYSEISHPSGFLFPFFPIFIIFASKKILDISIKTKEEGQIVS